MLVTVSYPFWLPHYSTLCMHISSLLNVQMLKPGGIYKVCLRWFVYILCEITSNDHGTIIEEKKWFYPKKSTSHLKDILIKSLRYGENLLTLEDKVVSLIWPHVVLIQSCQPTVLLLCLLHPTLILNHANINWGVIQRRKEGSCANVWAGKSQVTPLCPSLTSF